MFNLLAAAKGQLGQMQQGQSEGNDFLKGILEENHFIKQVLANVSSFMAVPLQGPLMYMGDGKVSGTVTSGRRVYQFWMNAMSFRFMMMVNEKENKAVVYW